MFRNAAFASLIVLGTAAGAAQAADGEPRLVNRNGSQEVVYEQGRDNIVGGAYATIAGGGDNTVYSAAPGARTEAAAPVARLVGGGDNAQVIYTAPAGAGALAGTLPGPSFGG